jgi:putative acetyltransferase
VRDRQGRLRTAHAGPVSAAFDAMPHSAPHIRIVPFHDDLAPDFARLNRAWLEESGLYEPIDEVQLSTPRESIIARGGEIFFAIAGQSVLGCVGVIPDGDASVELVKLSVSAEARGRGIGRTLIDTVIGFAQERRATVINLASSTLLTPALRLYRELGFVDVDPPDASPYQRADVWMALHVSERTLQD